MIHCNSFSVFQVNKGKVPKNRLALRLLAEEMIQWPNLEVLSQLEHLAFLTLEMLIVRHLQSTVCAFS